MAVKKTSGLGRGLDALLGGARNAPVAKLADVDHPSDLAMPVPSGPKEIHSLPVDLIGRSPYQPRVDFDPERLQELANSITVQGVMQPVVVRPVKDGRYELIAGERRWRATQLAGLGDIPVVVKDVPDQTAMAMALIENIQREDLNPIEEARALQRLNQDFKLTHEQVAEAVGRSRTGVTNMLRILELAPDILVLIEKRKLDMGHAKALLGLKGISQSEVAQQVAALGLSVRDTEKLVKNYGLKKDSNAPSLRSIDPDVRRLQDELAEKLGCPVTVQQSAGGKGKLIIQFNSLDELDGVLEHIQ